MDLPLASEAKDVLAQRTRARLFALLGELRRPAGTAELAERLRLHPNGVRVHLELLERADLVVRTRERHGRGRPRDTWAIAPDARPGGGPPTGYADLGRWLARAIPSKATRLREVERAGREIGRELVPPGKGAGLEAITAALAALGFQPHSKVGPQGHLTLCLKNCPYREAVRANQPIVCELHRGITLGLLDTLLPQAQLTDFVARDPDEAGCLIKLEGAGGEVAGDASVR